MLTQIIGCWKKPPGLLMLTTETLAKNIQDLTEICQWYNNLSSYLKESINSLILQHLHKLRAAAAQKGTQLRFLPPNFTKHKANTTYLDWKTKKLEWRLEWRFTWANLTSFDAKYIIVLQLSPMTLTNRFFS